MNIPLKVLVEVHAAMLPLAEARGLEMTASEWHTLMKACSHLGAYLEPILKAQEVEVMM